MKKFKIMDKRLFDYEIKPNPIVKREAPNVVIFSNTGKKNNEEDSANNKEKQSESVNSVHTSDKLPSPAKKNKTKLTIEDYRKLNRNRNNEEKTDAFKEVQISQQQANSSPMAAFERDRQSSQDEKLRTRRSSSNCASRGDADDDRSMQRVRLNEDKKNQFKLSVFKNQLKDRTGNP